MIWHDQIGKYYLNIFWKVTVKLLTAKQPIFQKTHLLCQNKVLLALLRQHDQLIVISVLTVSVHNLLESLLWVG